MLLARHAQSEWNVTGRWQGQEDPPLSDLGRTQASSAAGQIGTVDLIVSSDLQRALSTATTISTSIGVGPVMMDPGLRERFLGEWQGLTRAEIDSGWPGWLEEGKLPPSAEPIEDVIGRLVSSLDTIAAEHSGAEVLVISHGGAVYALEHRAGLPFERIANLAGREIVHHGRPGHLSLGERVSLLDDELASTPGGH